MYFKKNIINQFFLNLFIIVIFFIYLHLNKIYGICDKKSFFDLCCIIETDSEIIEPPNTSNNAEQIDFWKNKLVLKYINDKKSNKKIEVMYDYDYQGRLKHKNYISREQEFIYGYNYKDQIIYKYDLKNINSYTVYEYNDKGQIILAMDCGNKSKIKYEYNKKNQLIKIIEFCSCEKSFLKKNIINYKYNDKGQKIKKTSYFLLFRRNPFLSNFIQKIKKRDFASYTYEYNDEGQKIKKINRQNGNFFSYRYYSFDENFI